MGMDTETIDRIIFTYRSGHENSAKFLTSDEIAQYLATDLAPYRELIGANIKGQWANRIKKLTFSVSHGKMIPVRNKNNGHKLLPCKSQVISYGVKNIELKKSKVFFSIQLRGYIIEMALPEGRVFVGGDKRTYWVFKSHAYERSHERINMHKKNFLRIISGLSCGYLPASRFRDSSGISWVTPFGMFLGNEIKVSDKVNMFIVNTYISPDMYSKRQLDIATTAFSRGLGQTDFDTIYQHFDSLQATANYKNQVRRYAQYMQNDFDWIVE